MFRFEEGYLDDFMDQDTAVRRALARAERGLFDVDETKDEDLAALNER